MRFSPSFRLILVALLCCLTLSMPLAVARAQDGASSEADFARLVAVGRFDDARQALQSRQGNSPSYALHRTFLEALIAKAQGANGEALVLLRATLVIEPKFVPARVELAGLLLATGAHDAAQYHFDILALSADPGVRQLAQAAQRQIVQSRDFGASVHMSLAPSTNINKGSGHTTFNAGNLEFAIAPDSRQASGTGLNVGGTVFRVLPLGDGRRLVGTLGADLTADIDRIGADQFTIKAGLALSGEAGGINYSFGPTGDFTLARWTPHLFRYGVGGQASTQMGGQNLVSASFALLAQDYAVETYRNGFRVTGAAGITHAFTSATSAALQLGFDAERTQRPHLDYDGINFNLRVHSDWSGGLMTTAFARLEQRSYLGNYPAMAEPRNDTRLSAGMTVSHRQFEIGGFTPTLTYQYARQFSNVSFFDYDSHDLSLGLSQNF